VSYLPDKTFENVKAQVGSSVSAQTISNTFAAVEGTTITYTPAAGADYVVYEAQVQFNYGHYPAEWVAHKDFLHLRLQEDSNGWTDIDSTRFNSYTLYYSYVPEKMRFILPTTGWTGARGLRLAGRAWVDNYSVELHKTKSWDSNGIQLLSYPHVTVYSITEE